MDASENKWAEAIKGIVTPATISPDQGRVEQAVKTPATPTSPPKHTHPTEGELNALGARVVALLDGLPVSMALSVLDHYARVLILDGNTVDVNCPRYQGLRAALKLPPLASV